MLSSETKRLIDEARDYLVGVVPNPLNQIEQITFALIYKFMYDMDKASLKVGGKASFFTGSLKEYSWDKLIDSRLGNHEKFALYSEALEKFAEAKQLPELFRSIFKSAFLPYKAPETLGMFLKVLNKFDYNHPEDLGNAYEYLLSIMSSQGDAGQFRTPRHIIKFMVDVMNPKKTEKILDPACGTGGFLIYSYRHIVEQHDGKDDPKGKEKPLTPDDRKKLMQNLEGYDIDPSMVRMSQVNMYLHQFKNPQIFQYDTLTSEDRWSDKYDVILANPPFMSPRGGILPHNKFSVTSTRAEVLFVDYIMNHLKPKGRAGIIVPEGIIFQSGVAYKALRKNLVESGLYAVVSLPGGVFNPYSGVKTSILLIDNQLSKQKSEIAFIKISADGYDLGATKREVSRNELPLALESLKAWASGENIDSAIFTLVSKEEIARKGDYNLSGDRYKVGVDYSNAQWPMVELGECVDIYNGSTPKKSEGKYWESGTIPWFTVEDIRIQGRIIRATRQSVTEIALKETSIKLLPKDSVLLCCTASLGEYAYSEIEVTTNQQFNGLVVKDTSLLLPKYLFWCVSSFKLELERMSGKATFGFVSVGNLKDFKIPLPPLKVQEQIVAELDGYAAIISGAKQIVENWKPRIDVDPKWEVKPLGQVLSLEYGKPLKQEDRVDGPYPVFGSNGQVGFHNEFLVNGPMVIVGRKGSAGAVTWSNSNGYPIDTTFYVSLLNPKETNLKFVYFTLSGLNLDKVNTQAGVPGLNRNDAYELPFPLPSIEIQDEIVNHFMAEEIMVNSVKSLIETYEARIQAVIAKLWGE